MIENDAQRAATVKQIGALRKAWAEARHAPQDRLTTAYVRALYADIQALENELRIYDGQYHYWTVVEDGESVGMPDTAADSKTIEEKIELPTKRHRPASGH